jgi:LmbE family N-acetylglucosaminyl deacetylase
MFVLRTSGLRAGVVVLFPGIAAPVKTAENSSMMKSRAFLKNIALGLLGVIGAGTVMLAADGPSPAGYAPQPKKAALMLVIAHPDDEAYFPGLIPYLSQVRKLPMMVIVLTSGEAGLNPPGDRGLREEEMRRACRVYGLPNQPIFARFADGAYLGTLEENWKLWGGEQKAAEYLVEQIRRYQPDVIVTHALDGEYGHPNHVGCALSVTKACAGAADAVVFPVPPGGQAPWTTKKLYVHRWATRPMEHRWDIPIPGLNGRTCLEVGNAGGREHVSQGYAGKDFAELDGEKSSKFGLYYTSVGPDRKADGFFENIDLSCYNAADRP